MKCYTCGRQTEHHAPGCPDAKKDPKTVGVSDELFDTVFKASCDFGSEPECANCRAMRRHKTIGDTVLRISSTSIYPGAITSVVAYPDNEIKLLRLWIDEDVAPHFHIGGMIAYNVHLLPPDWIPASHFSMAHRENYHLATEWNAKLSPAQRLIMHVRNDSDKPREFRGLFECKTIDHNAGCQHCGSRTPPFNGTCRVCCNSFKP